MNLSNEHLIRRHVAERLAAAEAYHARRRVIDERREQHRRAVHGFEGVDRRLRRLAEVSRGA